MQSKCFRHTVSAVAGQLGLKSSRPLGQLGLSQHGSEYFQSFQLYGIWLVCIVNVYIVFQTELIKLLIDRIWAELAT